MHQGQLGIHLLEPGILGLQVSHMLELGDFHAGVGSLPLVVGGVRDAMLAAGLAHPGAQFDLLEDRHNLLLGELRFLHVELPFREKLYFTLVQISEEASVKLHVAVHPPGAFVVPGMTIQTKALMAFPEIPTSVLRHQIVECVHHRCVRLTPISCWSVVRRPRQASHLAGPGLRQVMVSDQHFHH